MLKKYIVVLLLFSIVLSSCSKGIDPVRVYRSSAPLSPFSDAISDRCHPSFIRSNSDLHTPISIPAWRFKPFVIPDTVRPSYSPSVETSPVETSPVGTSIPLLA